VKEFRSVFRLQQSKTTFVTPKREQTMPNFTRRLLNQSAPNALGAILLAAALSIASPASASAQTERVIHHFTAGADGRNPYAGVIADARSNLYGTAVYSGAYTGYGEVYELSPPTTSGGAWTKTTLHQMNFYSDGGNPFAGLAIDAAGNLFGTNTNGGPLGFGTVYELSPPQTAGAAWTLTVLYSFTDGTDGANTGTGVTIGPNGELYGASPYPTGSVYRLSPPAAPGDPWVETTLYTFSGGADGRVPGDRYLNRASDGVIYGATVYGGEFDDGTVYQLAPPASPGGAWVETVLYSFTGGADGIRPILSDIGPSGELYGTTDDWSTAAYGSVFGLVPPSSGNPSWTYKSIWQFTGGTDGAAPFGVKRLESGALVGSAAQGGILPSACQSSGIHPGCGVIFELFPPSQQSAPWTETPLYSFTNDGSGGVPQGLVLSNRGGLYATSSDIDQDNNELGDGAVIAIKP
jgi:hypothetical protein